MAKPTKVSGLYASGISSPFRGDSDGGVALSEGNLYVDDQVFAVVNPNDSDNPFQNLGVSEKAVFANPEDPTWRRELRERIETQFRFLEQNNLARLVRLRFQRERPKDGDFTSTVQYINIETNNEQESTFGLTKEGDFGLRPI